MLHSGADNAPLVRGMVSALRESFIGNNPIQLWEVQKRHYIVNLELTFD
jgi:sulfur transfer protein SufE